MSILHLERCTSAGRNPRRGEEGEEENTFPRALFRAEEIEEEEEEKEESINDNLLLFV